MSDVCAHRGALLHFKDNATLQNAATNYEYFEDGVLLVEGGRIKAVGAAASLLDALPEGVPVVDHGERLITPGFVDAHCHAPQTGAIAGYGEQLLEWLENYIFPEEGRFADPAYAHAGNGFFLDELLRNGTTTAAMYSSSHRDATEDLFAQAYARGVRAVIGKTLMDRNATPETMDTPESAAADSKELIARWHGKGRLRYGLTPRFLPACSPAEMELVGRLKREHPDVYIQTHLSENVNEVALVKRLYPEAVDYLDAYDRFGVLSERTLFGHCIHCSDREFSRMAETGSVACWCPDSNAFLGSGIFDLARATRMGVRVALASDLAASTSVSMLSILSQAYKVTALRGDTQLSSFQGFYLITLGGANALGVDDAIGNFAPGKEADFVTLDPACTPLMRYRMTRSRSLQDKLFVYMMLGDDRAVASTYVAGAQAVFD